MVEITVSEQRKPYSWLRTLSKVAKEFAIWVLPQLAVFVLETNPDLASMSVGALVSMGTKTLVDYLKHK